MSIMEWTLEMFLQEAASSSPTPGGGSAAACSGALAAAMVCMAARLTAGKEGYADVWPEAEETAREAEVCLQRLKEGVQRDIDVFNVYMTVLRLPKGTDSQKHERAHKLQQASHDATQSPLAIAENSLRTIELARRLAPICNKNVVSDVGVAAAMALGAFNAALWSVKINLPTIQDKDYAEQVRSQCQIWQQRAEEQSAAAAAEVGKRMHF